MKNIASEVVRNIPLEALHNKSKEIDRTTFLLLDSRMDGMNTYYDVATVIYQNEWKLKIIWPRS